MRAITFVPPLYIHMPVYMNVQFNNSENIVQKPEQDTADIAIRDIVLS